MESRGWWVVYIGLGRCAGRKLGRHRDTHMAKDERGKDEGGGARDNAQEQDEVTAMMTTHSADGTSNEAHGDDVVVDGRESAYDNSETINHQRNETATAGGSSNEGNQQQQQQQQQRRQSQKVLHHHQHEQEEEHEQQFQQHATRKQTPSASMSRASVEFWHVRDGKKTFERLWEQLMDLCSAKAGKLAALKCESEERRRLLAAKHAELRSVECNDREGATLEDKLGARRIQLAELEKCIAEAEFTGKTYAHMRMRLRSILETAQAKNRAKEEESCAIADRLDAKTTAAKQIVANSRSTRYQLETLRRRLDARTAQLQRLVEMQRRQADKRKITGARPKTESRLHRLFNETTPMAKPSAAAAADMTAPAEMMVNQQRATTPHRPVSSAAGTSSSSSLQDESGSRKVGDTGTTSSTQTPSQQQHDDEQDAADDSLNEDAMLGGINHGASHRASELRRALRAPSLSPEDLTLTIDRIKQERERAAAMHTQAEDLRRMVEARESMLETTEAELAALKSSAEQQTSGELDALDAALESATSRLKKSSTASQRLQTLMAVAEFGLVNLNQRLRHFTCHGALDASESAAGHVGDAPEVDALGAGSFDAIQALGGQAEYAGDAGVGLIELANAIDSKLTQVCEMTQAPSSSTTAGAAAAPAVMQIVERTEPTMSTDHADQETRARPASPGIPRQSSDFDDATNVDERSHGDTLAAGVNDRERDRQAGTLGGFTPALQMSRWNDRTGQAHGEYGKGPTPPMSPETALNVVRYGLDDIDDHSTDESVRQRKVSQSSSVYRGSITGAYLHQAPARYVSPVNTTTTSLLLLLLWEFMFFSGLHQLCLFVCAASWWRTHTPCARVVCVCV